MRYRLILAGVLAAVSVGVVSSAAGQTGTGPDPLAEGRRLQEEMTKLQEAPGVKEVFDLSKKIEGLRNKNNAEQNELYAQMSKLEETDAYKAYAEKYNALSEKLNATGEAERKRLAEAARELYQARHGELQKLAVGDLAGAKGLGFDVLSYPRVDGSTSTQPLAAIVAARVLGVGYEWAYPEPSGSMFTRPPGIPPQYNMVSGAAGAFDRGSIYYGGSELDIAASRTYATGKTQREQRIASMINGLFAKNSNTHDAYVHLIEGACDINLTARPPSAEEAKLAQEKKVEIELIPIATDALVFIVHQSNPVKGVTLEQLKSIYELKTKQWRDVGGGDKEIRPFLREANSGSRELFDTLFFKTPTDDAYRRATGELYAQSMGGPYNRLTQEASGISYSVYYYEHFMALSPYTRNLAINGIEANAATLADGRYPLAAPVYAAVRKSDAAESAGRRLAAYLASAEGQAIVRESGYAPPKRAAQ